MSKRDSGTESSVQNEVPNDVDNQVRHLSIGIIMGSDSDLRIMRHSGRALTRLGLQRGVDYEERIVSAHRTPEMMRSYALQLEETGVQAVIAGAGGSAHLPAMVESFVDSPSIHIIGVAINKNPEVMNPALGSMISLPEGTPLIIAGQNETGAFNAGLIAAKLLSRSIPELGEAYQAYKATMKNEVAYKDSRLATEGSAVYLEMMKGDYFS